jgi:hypothetical protein
VRIGPALIVVATAWACGRPAARPPAIRFLHTFGSEETELFNTTMAERGITVEPLLAPFARGQQVIGEILHAQNCPDLIRIDATWLPGLVANHLLAVAPAALTQLDWTPEAAALAQLGGVWWGLPQAVDGLLVIHDLATPAPASPSLADLLAAARAARAGTRPYPLGVRVDGYWFVPWLRDEGGELAAPALARAAEAALRDAQMLPREPITPFLFDDLQPALSAVVAGDATAEEAIAGVRRGWQRLTRPVAPGAP